MDRRFLVILGVVILALGGIFVISSKNSPSSGNTGGTGTVSNHSVGGNAKNVEVVEYADFQCPACSAFHTITKQVQQKYANDIKWTFRHFPLEQIHQNARAASRAAEAAGLQGKFFEMYDLLFEQQSAWENAPDAKSVFQGYARQLGLDISKFDTDYASEGVNSTINADKNEGTNKGVEGTPTFFIAGVKMSNSDLQSVDAFSAEIDKAIKNAAGPN